MRVLLAEETMDRILARPLRKQVLNRRYDAIWINSIASWRLCDAISPVCLPQVLYVHELDYIIKQLEVPENRFANLADKFIANSRATRDAMVYRFGIDASRTAVVYPTVGVQYVRSLDKQEKASGRRELGVGPGDILVMGCGVGQLHKGIDLLPQLLATLNRKYERSETHVLWVGQCDPAMKRMLNEASCRLGFAERLHLVDEVADPTHFFQLSDVFVLPSREESFGLVCLEAAQCGLPTVCFERAGGAPEFVEDDAGLVVPYLDIEAMATAVVGLAKDADLRRRMGTRARAKVDERFTAEKQGPKFLEEIEQVVRRDVASVETTDSSEVGPRSV